MGKGNEDSFDSNENESFISEDVNLNQSLDIPDLNVSDLERDSFVLENGIHDEEDFDEDENRKNGVIGEVDEAGVGEDSFTEVDNTIDFDAPYIEDDPLVEERNRQIAAASNHFLEIDKRAEHAFGYKAVQNNAAAYMTWKEHEKNRRLSKKAFSNVVRYYQNCPQNDKDLNKVLTKLSEYSAMDTTSDRSYWLEGQIFIEIEHELGDYLVMLDEREKKMLKDEENTFSKKENGTNVPITKEEIEATPELLQKFVKNNMAFDELDEKRRIAYDLLDQMERAKNGNLAVPFEDEHPYVIDGKGVKFHFSDHSARWVDCKDRPLFPHEPNMNDISQGYYGDCYFITALASLAEKNPQIIKDAIKDNGDGTATVRLYGKKNNKEFFPVYVTVDKTVPTYFSVTSSSRNCLWANCFEKALALSGMASSSGLMDSKWKPAPPDMAVRYQEIKSRHDNKEYTDQDYKKLKEDYPFLFGSKHNEILPWPNYDNAEGGWPANSIEMICGPNMNQEAVTMPWISADEVNNLSYTYEQNSFFDFINERIKQKDIMTITSGNGIILDDIDKVDDESLKARRGDVAIASDHAYSLIGAYEAPNGAKMLRVRNPWGTTFLKNGLKTEFKKDGKKVREWTNVKDGIFDVELKDALVLFDHIFINGKYADAKTYNNTEPFTNPKLHDFSAVSNPEKLFVYLSQAAAAKINPEHGFYNAGKVVRIKPAEFERADFINFQDTVNNVIDARFVDAMEKEGLDEAEKNKIKDTRNRTFSPVLTFFEKCRDNMQKVLEEKYGGKISAADGLELAGRIIVEERDKLKANSKNPKEVDDFIFEFSDYMLEKLTTLKDVEKAGKSPDNGEMQKAFDDMSKILNEKNPNQKFVLSYVRSIGENKINTTEGEENVTKLFVDEKGVKRAEITIKSKPVVLGNRVLEPARYVVPFEKIFDKATIVLSDMRPEVLEGKLQPGEFVRNEALNAEENQDGRVSFEVMTNYLNCVNDLETVMKASRGAFGIGSSQFKNLCDKVTEVRKDMTRLTGRPMNDLTQTLKGLEECLAAYDKRCENSPKSGWRRELRVNACTMLRGLINKASEGVTEPRKEAEESYARNIVKYAAGKRHVAIEDDKVQETATKLLESEQYGGALRSVNFYWQMNPTEKQMDHLIAEYEKNSAAPKVQEKSTMEKIANSVM